MSGNIPGARQRKQSSTKTKLAQLETMVANIQQALSIQKIVFEQFSKNLGNLDKDVHNSMGIINDLQYRTLALVELANDKDTIDKIAEGLKLKDFSDASDRDDARNGYEVDDKIKEDSVVILTSECLSDADKAIFRTKFKLDEEVVVDDTKNALLGLKVGDKTGKVKLPDGTEHILEVVGIRKQGPKPEQQADSSNNDQAALQQ